MIASNKNNETEKETSRFENVKQLNAMLQGGGQGGSEVSHLMGGIKDVRRKLDGLLSAQKEIVKTQELKRRQQAEKTERVEEKPLPPIFDAPQKAEIKAETPVKAEEKPTPAPVKTENAEKPAPAPAPVVTRTKTIDNTPSYIRGKITPPTPAPRPVGNSYVPRQNQGGTGYNQNRPQGGQNSFQRPAGTGFQRPAGTGFQRPQAPGVKRPSPLAKPDIGLAANAGQRKSFGDAPKKKEFVKSGEDKKAMTKRTLIRKGFIQEDMDDERMGTRKLKNKRMKDQISFTAPKVEKAIITTENLTVKILSEKIGKTAQEIIKQLMVLGIMTSINSVVDFPTMELVANELGVELELKLEQTKEEIIEAEHDKQDDEKDLVKRPPIITVMGHVDHGKTSLLDAIRKTNVVTGEAGGITQHIGAYSVTCKNEKITFLDTPGHEAFTEMRARGAKVTDIAILVVAADDGIMPQTVEAINHAKQANVPIIVAINKIDKPAANVEKVKQMLTEYGLVTEEWGGDTMVVPISAKQGTGIDKLLETVLFLAEYNAYKANPDRMARGSVIEAKLDKGKGPVANVIVLNGTLHVGDYVVSGYTCGKVRALVDDKGRNVKEALPSTPVSILGLTEVPSAGESIMAVKDEKMAKQVVAERTAKMKNEQANQSQKVTLDDVFNKISEGTMKELNLVVKADVQGSVEALKNSLLKLTSDEVRINVVHGGVGAINKSDLMLAGVSNAIIVGFNVRPDAESKTLAEATGVDIRLYKIIYEALEDIERSMKGMVEPKYNEVVIGHAEVRNVFKITGAGQIAGSYVLDGKIERKAKVRVKRGADVVFTGSIAGLKRFKDDVKDVAAGYECGISIDNFSEIAEGDIIEAYNLEVVKA